MALHAVHRLSDRIRLRLNGETGACHERTHLYVSLTRYSVTAGTATACSGVHFGTNAATQCLSMRVDKTIVYMTPTTCAMCVVSTCRYISVPGQLH
jgi:hypothetical protein